MTELWMRIGASSFEIETSVVWLAANQNGSGVVRDRCNGGVYVFER